MDEYSGKRAMDGLVVSRKGSGLVLRETANNRDQNAQFCNRLGCNGRLNYTRGTQINSSEKPKSSRPSFRSSSGKEIIGTSSRTCSAANSPRKSFRESQKKMSSQLETDSSETSSVQDEPEVSELNSPPGKIQRGLQPESEDSQASEVTSMEVGSSNIASSTRPRKNLLKRTGLGSQDALSSSSVSLASKCTSQGVRHGTNASRYGLRNLRCNSISDVIPSGCPSSDLSLNKRKDMLKKRNSEGESSSSARGKKMSGLPLEDGQNSSSNHGISISDSRRARNCYPSRDNGVASVRTRRSINGNPRVRFNNQGNGNSLSPNESPVMIPQMNQPEIPTTVNAPSSSHQISAENHSSHPNSNSRPGSSSESLHSRVPVGPAEVGITRSLMNQDIFRHYNMDGIAEVLLALERIEQDEELSYEQLLVLETNLFLNGLSFHDQHRDMRLDIDNMTYEELLALEERMGNVSTALTEEAVAKCLERSTYNLTPPEAVAMGFCGEDDVKCSVCQEEYMVGDEMGRLQCEHRYHAVCIHQWLQLKNWCPICKAPAASLSPSSSPPPSTPS